MTMRVIKLRRRPLRDRVSLLTTQLEQQRIRIDALAERVATLEKPTNITVEPRYYTEAEVLEQKKA